MFKNKDLIQILLDIRLNLKKQHHINVYQT